jgi:flagellar hook assembly protein FlgD
MFVLFLLTLTLSGQALAALGGDETSISTDQTRMKASRRIVSAANYTTHEILQASGTLVREYISAQGKVFAVTWQGPLMPDLQAILGEHFAAFATAQNNKRTRRGHLLLQQPGLVIQSAGHMRAFFGRAYLPQFLPSGVSIDDIQ